MLSLVVPHLEYETHDCHAVGLQVKENIQLLHTDMSQLPWILEKSVSLVAVGIKG